MFNQGAIRTGASIHHGSQHSQCRICCKPKPAANEISYMIGNNNQVSYHVAVDDKEVIQAIPFNRSAWHCGEGGGSTDPNALKKGNRLSIGIEIC
ncbi:N-acetylmuramoyl-L-alanine amidase [Lysinibacillus fusiformis]|uniref:N-acetylmuramoyl-L-alanine amidase n=1 Tax=Lysinibacillus fusiformis TaxID=28031 RepID=UPI003CFA49E4